MMNFNINVRTCYSFYRSIIKPEDLINYCLNNDYQEVIFTDVNNLSATTYLSELCQTHNLRFILGMEVMIDNESLLLFPLDVKGYQNLCRICSLLNHDGKEIGWNDISIYFNNLLIVVKSSNLIDLFENLTVDKNNIFYSHHLRERELKKENLLFCHEVNYLEEEDKKILEILDAVRTKQKLSDLNNNKELETVKFLIKDDFERLDDLYIQNLKKFYQKINFTFQIKEIPIIEYSLDKNSYSLLQKKAKSELEIFFKKNKTPIPLRDKYNARLDLELDTIKKLNFVDYFLIVNDFINFAIKENILYGPGRGSAVGSLLCFLLKITKIDPIKYNLIFERFMNLSRVSPPDIDIDFDSDQRNEIINYIFRRFSNHNVSYIGTYSFVKAKTALRDVGRVFEIDLKYINLICKDLDPECLDIITYYEDHQLHFNKIYPYKGSLEFLKIANKIIGLPRQFGVHPAGIILSKFDLHSSLPLNIDLNNHPITQYDNLQISKFNINKIDILGIKNISIINRTILQIEKFTNKKIDLDKIDFDDPKIFWEYTQGNTEGIFQLESYGIRKLLRELKVNSLNDIFLAISLYRPGPMEQARELINRKKGIVAITYPDPELESVLKETYGIIIFQEQIMYITQIFAGFSLSDADNFRRGISKKDQTVFGKYKDKFINQAVKKGNSSELSLQVFSLIEKFANYGFNKSHAVGYGILGYQMFYLKVYFPLYFFCQLLNYHIGDVKKTYTYLNLFKKKYFKQHPIIPFNLFAPSGEFQIIDNKLQFGLFLIKGVGESLLRQLLSAQTELDEVKEDFIKVIVVLLKYKVNIKNIIVLIIFDAFYQFKNLNKTTMIKNLEQIQQYGQIVIDKDKTINWDLIAKPEIVNYPENEDSLKELQSKILGFKWSFKR